MKTVTNRDALITRTLSIAAAARQVAGKPHRHDCSQHCRPPVLAAIMPM